MAGLVINGSHVLGPVSSGSSITTLPAYLASIGKNSWYAQFLAGTNMWTGTTLNGSAASLNGNVGSWGPNSANTSGFTAYWTQSGGSTSQPFYATSNGINSLVGSGNDAGDTRWMELSSTTALNGTYTVLCRHPVFARDNRAPYSHNTNSFYWQSGTGTLSLVSAMSASGTTAADQIIHVCRNAPGTSSGNLLFGISQTGTAHNNVAPRLFRRSTSYSISSISEMWVVPQLTANELDAAMTYVT